VYKIIPWSSELDLADFYNAAAAKGFKNNSSQELMINCFYKEKKWQAWILYHNDIAVGSVVAHSLDCLPNAFRICARTCILTNHLTGPYGNALRTKRVITEHQNPTAQFFIPTCIEWCDNDADLYITTNASTVASQRRVNNIFAPLLEKTGVLELAHVLEYRGHKQNFWKLNVDRFYNQLNKYERWS
jgi:hypothetical protein